MAALATLLLIAIVSPASAELKIERITVKESPAPDAAGPAVVHIGIATAHFPLYAIAQRLSRGTAFLPVDEGDCSIELMLHWKAADPTDTSTDGCPDTVKLDATALEGGGVGIALAPGGEPGKFWLSLANLSRMAELLAAQLVARYPNTAEAVEQNLNGVKSEFFSLQRLIAMRSADAANMEVYLQDSGLRYLAESLGLQVLGNVKNAESDSGSSGPLILGTSSGPPSVRWTCQIDPLRWPENEPTFEELVATYAKNINLVFDTLSQPPRTQ